MEQIKANFYENCGTGLHLVPPLTFNIIHPYLYKLLRKKDKKREKKSGSRARGTRVEGRRVGRPPLVLSVTAKLQLQSNSHGENTSQRKDDVRYARGSWIRTVSIQDICVRASKYPK